MKQLIGQILALASVGAFLFGAGFDFLSYWEMTRPEYVALGILMAAATLWITEAVPLFVTSLFVLFLSIVWLVPVMNDAGIAIDQSQFTSQFFSDIILLFLGGFVLSAALHKQKIDEWAARWIIQKTGSSTPKLMLGVMAITAFLSMWLSNTAAAAMMLAMIIPITARLPSGHRYRQALLLSVPFAANIGGLGTPIGSPPNAIALQYMQRVDLAPGFGMWMLIGVPGVITMLVLCWGVLLVLFRDESTRLIVDQTAGEQPSGPALAVVLATTGLTVVGWVTTSLHGYSSGTVALFPLLVLFSVGILNVKDLRSLSWDVLLLMGGGLCLGTAISSSGLAAWLIALLPVEGVTAFWLMVIFGTVACLMSSVMSNTATANLIMPIILGLNVEPLSPLLIGTAFACTLAMPLPVSTPPNAMAFSTDQLSVVDMVRPGILVTIAGVILAFTTGYWWWDLVGLF
jgi:sodium-dependent dicarboxylate transporter 2/3/5